MTIRDTAVDQNVDPEIAGNVADYLNDRYEEHLKEFPDMDGKSVYISLEDLYDYDEDMYKTMRNSPTEWLYSAEDALRNYDSSIPGLDEASLRFKDPVNVLSMDKVREENANNLVCFDAMVSKAANIRQIANEIGWKCKTCGAVTPVAQRGEDVEYPIECSDEDCNASSNSDFRMSMEDSDMMSFEHVRVQEPTEDMTRAAEPETINLQVFGDITGDVPPGERVTVMGILRVKGEKTAAGTLTSTVMEPYIEVVNLQPEKEDFEEVQITDEDIEQFEEYAEREDVYDLLTRSVAPSIRGLDTPKISMVMQLFSGVTKFEDSGKSRVRGDIHVLVVGDPGTGKSQLLQFVSNISPRGIYASGKGVSGAGLTAAAVQDEFDNGDWTLEAGVLPLSDKGIACVDEIDKMQKSDRDSMHEALEQQTISVAKAGINATLNARCSLLAAANPSMGRFEEYSKVAEQIDLDPALISRFDLIFTVTDEPDEDRDRDIAQHILKHNEEGQKEASGEESEDDTEEIIPQDVFKKYVAYARNNYFPELTDRAKKELEDFYVQTRQEGSEDAIPVTARKLEGLIRLSEASARVRLSDKITLDDAKRAVKLVKSSLDDVGRDPETGELDIDVLETGTSHTERDRIRDIKKIFKQEDDNEIYKDDFFDIAEDHGMEEDKVKEELQTLKREGEVVEKPNGMLKLM